ncbi:DUF3822 family protein [Ferruginibacter lapsinanis]|uniref:DUF3822 family protein n=1 Tax=Ferruginibacter lapsinanis TaxID=563172 RepID=UPI001E5BEDC6|nr:DUF3822 family protein [Ferruginibacter lapsinanis]UEG49429.1 DUF3822 family protein [Ferruginibacter lapsinanis]
MTPLFNIQPIGIDLSTAHLFIEMGEHGLSLYILDDTNTFSSICVYQFPDKLNVENNIRSILYEEPFLKQKFKKVDIIYCFSESVLVPKELAEMEANKNMLDLVYGDFPDKVIRGDFMFRYGIQNVYRTPKSVEMIMNNLFPTATITHLYSVLPDLVSKQGNNLFAAFCSNHIITLLMKDDKIQVIQKFAYQKPEDAAYHLLNVCVSFDTAVADVNLTLSGMIDTTSNLYNELHKYFEHIEFGSLPDKFQYTDEIANYPSHFFSHLFGIAACV